MVFTAELRRLQRRYLGLSEMLEMRSGRICRGKFEEDQREMCGK